MTVAANVIRRATPEELEADINAFLAPLLNYAITHVQIDHVKNAPFYTENLYAALTLDSASAVLMATPYQAKTFVAATEDEAINLYVAFLIANPTWFVSPIFAVYRPAEPQAQNGVIIVAFFNQDHDAGQYNWQAVRIFGTLDVQVFLASGVWNKPIWSKTVTISAIGAGGSGGGGARGAAGISLRGGGGGGGAALLQYTIPASWCTNTEPVTVGTSLGGAGGAADNTIGDDGSAGGSSSFGIFLRAEGGGRGQGGGFNAGGQGGNQGGVPTAPGGGRGGSSTATTGGIGARNPTVAVGCSGGGGGGSVGTTGGTFNGGAGSAGISWNATDSVGGIAGGGGAGTDGGLNVDAPPGATLPGGGAGGGGSGRGGGGNGGRGANYGGGGGGGGACQNGAIAGNGGDGGPGIVVVISR